MKAVVIHAAGDLRVDEVDQVDEAGLGPADVRVRVGAGGICGSDLHYFRHGGFGTVRLREPMILGHEIAGTVAAGRPRRDHDRAGPEGGRQPEPGLRPMQVLRAGPAEPLPGHAVLRQRHALPPRARRVPGGADLHRRAGGCGARPRVADRGRLRRAARRVPPCRPAGRLAGRQARPGDGRGTDRRSHRRGRPPRGGRRDRRDRRGGCAARHRPDGRRRSGRSTSRPNRTACRTTRPTRGCST